MGWATTEVAATAVRVSPRTIRRHTKRGKIEAKPQGKGVRREWLVSADSFHGLRDTRSTGEGVPEVDRGVKYADGTAGVVRERAARPVSWAEVAAGLRVRLEPTERAQITLANERCQALRDLEWERERRELWPNGSARPSTVVGGARSPGASRSRRAGGPLRGAQPRHGGPIGRHDGVQHDQGGPPLRRALRHHSP